MSHLDLKPILRGPRLAAVVRHQIEENPRAHRQGQWTSSLVHECGTTACAGGWVIHLSGDHRFINRWGSVTGPLTESGDLTWVAPVARALLGISFEARSYLFSADRTRFEVINALRCIEEGRLDDLIPWDYDPEEDGDIGIREDGEPE